MHVVSSAINRTEYVHWMEVFHFITRFIYFSWNFFFLAFVSVSNAHRKRLRILTLSISEKEINQQQIVVGIQTVLALNGKNELRHQAKWRQKKRAKFKYSHSANQWIEIRIHHASFMRNSNIVFEKSEPSKKCMHEMSHIYRRLTRELNYLNFFIRAFATSNAPRRRRQIPIKYQKTYVFLSVHRIAGRTSHLPWTPRSIPKKVNIESDMFGGVVDTNK